MHNWTLVSVNITAPKINLKQFLEPGEIDITDIDPSTINQDITTTINHKFLYCRVPVNIVYKNFRKKAVEACSARCNNRLEVDNWFKTHRHAIIYQVLFNTINNKYMIRYFDLSLNLIDRISTRILLRKLWKFHKGVKHA